ncbi:MAG: DNA polymerase [Syntrophobacteraceae bacterium]
MQDTLYNTPIQGTVADITKKALCLLPQRLSAVGARIIGTVHDEIILEIAEEKASDAATILEGTMIKAGEAYLVRVPVEVEVAIGETWAEK